MLRRALSPVRSQLHDLVNGAYSSKIASYHIVDCRFDYEYNGGHVVGAVNLQSEDDIEAHLLMDGRGAYSGGGTLPAPSISGLPDDLGEAKKTVVIFHCEFSQKRGPELSVPLLSALRLCCSKAETTPSYTAVFSYRSAKLLRKRDRAANQKSYPKLFYPELYILEGGYCDFFRQQPVRPVPRFLPQPLTSRSDSRDQHFSFLQQLCNPRAYVSMDDPAHVAKRASEIHTMRKFHRAQSWQETRSQPLPPPSRPPLRPHSTIAPTLPSQRITYERRTFVAGPSSTAASPPPVDDHEDENTFADSSFADSSFEDSFGEGSPARPASRTGSMLGGSGGLLGGGLKPSLGPPVVRMGSLLPRTGRIERSTSSAPQSFTLGSSSGPARNFTRAQSWQAPSTTLGPSGRPSEISSSSGPSRPPLAGIFPLAFQSAQAAKGRRRAGSIIGEEDGGD